MPRDKRRERTRTLTLIAGALLLVLSLAGPCVTIHAGCSWWERALAPLFHAQLLHAFLNVWCLTAISFYYAPRGLDYVLAYLIAVACPCAHTTGLCGLSCVCFALLGMTIWRVRSKRVYVLALVPALVIGLLLPHVAGWQHVYAFAAGVLIKVLV